MKKSTITAIATISALAIPSIAFAQPVTPSLDELAAQVASLSAERDRLLELLSMLGVSGPVALLAVLYSGWKAAQARMSSLVGEIGSDLAKVAERERLRDAALRREVLIVSESVQLSLWRFVTRHLPNVRAVEYGEALSEDLSGKIVVCVPSPAAGETGARGADFGPATARMETWLAQARGVSIPHAVLVQGGILAPEVFASLNEAGVLISQAPARLLRDIEDLLAR